MKTEKVEAKSKRDGENVKIDWGPIIELMRTWLDRNFKKRDPWVGMIEENGEFAHAYLKRLQGIRNVSEDMLFDAAADVVIYMSDYCQKLGLDFCRVMELSDTVNCKQLDLVLRRYSESIWELEWVTVAYISERLAVLEGVPGKYFERSLTDSKRMQVLAEIVRMYQELFAAKQEDFNVYLKRTWMNVLRRNWKNNPESGNPLSEKLKNKGGRDIK